MDDHEQKIEKLKAYFEKRDDVVMAFLFGSQAEERAHASSDWDIAVYFKPERERVEFEADHKEYGQEHDVWSDVECIVGSEVDLLVLNRIAASIADTAIQGIQLVIKDWGLWLEFMLAVSREAEDFRKTAKEYAEVYWRSASLSERDAHILERRLVFLDSELQVLPEYVALTWLDYQQHRDKQRQVERLIENVINAVIDITKTILASEKRPIPSSYKGMVREACAILSFPLEAADQFAEWAELRNILAHEYLDYRWDKIHPFLEKAEPILLSFVRTVRAFIEKQNH
ncbi:MAG: HepT-like ribonuclease domain-containing protein [Patescibacteria group bacterium]